MNRNEEPVHIESQETNKINVIETEAEENTCLENEGKNKENEKSHLDSIASVLGFQTDVRKIGNERKLKLDDTTNEDMGEVIKTMYIGFRGLWTFVFILVFSFSIIKFYATAPHTLSGLMLNLLALSVVKNIITFIFFIRTRNIDQSMNITYFMDILLNISFGVLFYGLYLYFSNQLTNVYLFAIHHIITTIVIYFAHPDDNQFSIEMRFFRCVESIQIIIVLSNLDNANLVKHWGDLTVVYSIVFICCLMIAVILFIVAFGVFITTLCGENGNRTCGSLALSVGLVIASGFFLACYFIYVGVFLLFREGVISNKPISKEIQDKTLYYTCVVLFSYCSVIVLLGSLFGLFFRRALRNHLNKSETGTVSIISFAKEMKLALTKKSETYYVEDPDFDKNQIVVKEGEDECILCYNSKNEVIVKPCGHSGFCKECMMSYIKKDTICPYCKEAMDTLIIFYYDEERAGNYSKEAIKLI